MVESSMTLADGLPEKTLSPKLAGCEKKLIICAAMFNGALGFGSYLIQKWTLDSNGGQIGELIKQFAMQLLPWIISYFFTLRFCHRISIARLFSLSFVLCATGYSVFFVLASSGNTYLGNLLFGAIFGFGQGMYWSCYNNLQVSFVNRDKCGRFYGLNGFFTYMTCVSAPLIMLFFVIGFGGNSRVPYEVFLAFYILLLACFTVAFITSLTIKMPRYKNKLSLGGVFKHKKDKWWKNFMLLNLLYGTSSSIPDSIIGLYIIAFAVFKNYLYLLVFVITLIVSVFVNYLSSKPFFKANRKVFYYICLIVTPIIYLAFTITYDTNIGGYVAIVVMFFAAIFAMIRIQCENLMHYAGISGLGLDDAGLSSAYLLRELCIVTGKIIAMAVLLLLGLFGEKLSLIIAVALVYSITSLLTFLLVKKQFKELLRN